MTFNDKQGFSVSSNSQVSGSAPTITPNGASGANAVAAITLKSGSDLQVLNSSTLFLSGYSTGNAIFLAGDATAGEYLDNEETVT